MDFLGLGELVGLELVFGICALAGGIGFIVRAVLFAIGIGDGDFDADVDVETDGGTGGLSVHGITAFFMMFGLVGLALLRGSGTGPALAIAGAAAAGVFSLWLSGQLYRVFRRLQSSGNARLDSAVGEEGTVYLTIPAGGTGKIQVVVSGRLRTFDARTEASEASEIPTGDRVRVLRVVDGSVFVVGRA